MKLSSVKVFILACSVVMSMAACTPFTKVQGDDKTVAKINGSWTVIHSGGEKLEGVDPKPTIIFNTSNNTISGFDGCNNYKGSYSFTDGKLRAKVASTRMACTSDVARAVSEQMADLFSNGADVVEVSIYGQHVIMLKNNSSDLRLGQSDLLN
jgi:heat shock protein HslJ